MADKPASWYSFHFRMASIPAFLNMPDTPKAEISACPCIIYPHNAYICDAFLLNEAYVADSKVEQQAFICVKGVVW